MALNERLIRKLDKQFEPSSLLSMRFAEKDLSFQTDENGYPILLFIGKKQENGSIKGERYSRVLKFTADGKKIKDHWDLKGKAGTK
ncbi:MAG: hypothetical protein JWN76_3331 [Chitinophagaceae bacterium]|nr:hypothetical protein [Chitinophagaceae bacterium]